LNGLQTALNQLNANCTPDAIAQKHADEVAKYQRKLDDAWPSLKYRWITTVTHRQSPNINARWMRHAPSSTA
jgi:hypothetical protein